MKKHLREQMKEKLAAMSPHEIADFSYQACERLTAADKFLRADSVMLYFPIPTEVDPSSAALRAWQAGKTVLAPWVDWKHKHMLAVRINAMDDGETGRYGLQQPPAGPVWPIEEIDFIIVPALAFDVSGGRLGRGGGFYDRFLAEPGMRATTCGLAFDLQVVDELPADGHDKPVDMLVTERRVIDIRKQQDAPEGRQG